MKKCETTLVTEEPSVDAAPVIRDIQFIAEEARASRLNDEFQLKVARSASRIANFLNSTDIQGILFSVIFNLNFRSVVDVSDLAQFLDFSMISASAHLNDIDLLVQKGILRCSKTTSKRNRKQCTSLNNIEFSVNRDVFDSIIRNDTNYTPKVEKLLDVYDLLKVCSSIIKDNDLDENEILVAIASIVQENSHIKFIQSIKPIELTPDSLLLFLALCSFFVAGDDEIDLPSVLERLFDYREIMRIRREFANNQHPLIIHGLVKLENGSFRSDRIITLSEKSLDLLFNEDKAFYINRKKDSHRVIQSEDIPEKKLFFNAEMQKQLNFLTSALTEPSYSELRGRLKSSGAPGGIVTLLHGSSGSGKTEYVYQLARSTHRDLIRVNISETRSKWFGESEKLIKKVFDDYRKRLEIGKITPILFFNEADGIIMARKTLSHASGSVSQTENSIQNIVLQELEDIDGIFIATTNLAQNLDSAIARRCLFKIHFDNGCSEIRHAIWVDKIIRNTLDQPILTDEEIQKLSEFKLSGGQIDNVSKKIMMNHLLTGVYPGFSDIVAYCKEESGFLNEDKKRIGYMG